MKVITYTSARNKLAEIMNKACEDHDPVVVSRKNYSAVVIISLEDFEAMAETSYLMQSPANAKRLLESINELEDGKGKVRDLLK